MDFLRISCQTRGPQFVSRFWKEFCKLIRATVSLTSGYHPESNGQTERLNQELETGLRCLVSQNPASWSKKKNHIWATTRKILLRNGDCMKRTADRRRRPAPLYQPGQKVWLSTQDLPIHVVSRKLAPRFVDPFPGSKVIGPSAVHLHLPWSLRVHPTFHVSQIKPVKDSPMVLTAKPPPTPWMVDGGPVYLRNFLLCATGAEVGNSWCTGRVMAQRNVPGSPQASLWILTSFLSSTTVTLRCLVRQEPSLEGGVLSWPRKLAVLRCLVYCSMVSCLILKLLLSSLFR